MRSPARRAPMSMVTWTHPNNISAPVPVLSRT
jgi:hypothetical protein